MITRKEMKKIMIKRKKNRGDIKKETEINNRKLFN